MTDYLISYDLKVGNPSPHRALLLAAEREGLLYVWKGLNYVSRLPNTTLWGVFASKEEANNAFDRAIAAASAIIGYRVVMTKRATSEFKDAFVNSDVRKAPDPQLTGASTFETSRLHQLRDSYFALG